jgi:RHS repeat-associated protein
MSVSSHAARLRRVAWLVGAVALAVLVQWSSWSAPAVARAPHATHRARTQPAPAGAKPVNRALPPDATPHHGLPKGKRPPPVPPETRAAGRPLHLSAAALAAVPHDGSGSTAGARNLVLRSGYALDDTSLVLYFDAAAPGVSGWSSWFATVYDPDTGTAQQSAPLTPADAAACGSPRQFCRSFGTADGWTLTDGHAYFATITVTLSDGGQATSDASGTARARTTSSPSVPAAQAAGCSCGDALAPTTYGQAVRGSGVDTGTGALVLRATDLRMPGVGVPFSDTRTYSSTAASAGSMGVGWTWTYDVRVIPPAGGTTAATVRAEDGAEAVYQQNADGSYGRPAGVRSTLSATASGWQLVTPDQVTYSFDATGRLTSVRNPRGLGTTIAYPSATQRTITDAAGRVVAVTIGSDGLVHAVSLPDGRTTRYGYSGNQLSQVTDATGATWKYGYTGGLLSTVTDPHKRVQLTTTYDGGRVVRQADALGAVTTFSWDPTKQEATTVDPDGVHYFDGYRGNVLVYSQNGNGDTVNQRYDTTINPNLLVDPKGNQTVSAFDGAGNVSSVTAPEPFSYTVSRTYDPHNNLTSQTDGLGHTTTLGYTSFSELSSITSPGGDQTVVSVDDRGLVTAVKDPRGKVTTMAYDAAGDLVSQTTPMGEKTTYAYDGTGRVTSTTDPRGNLPGADPADFTTRFAYDALDRLRKTYDPGKKDPWVTSYDDLGQLSSTADPLGDETDYDYTRELDRVASITDPDGNTTSYAYTAAGRQRSVTDGAGDETSYTYDDRGNLATVVSPRGNVAGANAALYTSTYSYDFNGNTVRVTHPYPGGGFASTTAGFDELNRQTTGTDQLGKTTTTAYDNDSNVVSTVDPVGNTTGISYDANGRPTVVTAPAGGNVSTAYDAAGNPVRRTSATGGVTTWSYDDDGRLSSTVEARGNVAGADPAAYTTHYGYDAAGDVTGTTDPLGHGTAFGYDGDQRITSATDPNGNTTGYRHDEADRLTQVTGPVPAAVATGTDQTGTSYRYDPAGHLTRRTDANGDSTGYDYDRAGRLADTTDALDRTTSYRYDAEGDLTTIVTPGDGGEASRSIVDSYDILGRQVGQDLAAGGTIYAYGYDAKNRLTSLSDPGGLRTQSYDAADRLTSVSRGGQSFSYSYDGDGNVTSRTLPDGTTEAATFDAADRMTGLTASGGVAGAGAGYTFGYDPAGRLTSTAGPGLTTTRGYDQAGRLSDLSSQNGSGVVARYQLSRDPAGNPTTITTSRGTASQAAAYTYDSANRVTAACYGATSCAGGPTGSVAYTYDAVGNRTTQALSGDLGSTTTRYRYDDADELTRATTGGDSTSYSYDAEGNLTRAGTSTFSYNLDHTLASATTGGATTSYGYDGQGLQVTAVSGGSTVTSRTSAWDVNGPAPRLAEQTATQATGSGSTSQGYLTDPTGNPLALLTGSATDGYAPDWLAGVADVVSPDGTPLVAYDYDPYGNPRTDGTASTVDTTGAASNPVQFAGYHQDPTLGAGYSTPARVYDPGTGRFNGTDPVPPALNAPSVSPYAYVSDMPTVFRDPSGATGGNADHDEALEFALQQLDARYGPFNVYGDIPGRQSLQGVPGTCRGGSMCFTTVNPQPGDPVTSYPDIIARSGDSTYVWDIKPASDQLSSIKPDLPIRGVQNANEIKRMVAAVGGRYPNSQPGPNIVPATRTDADGSVLTIFSGADWNAYAPRGKRAAADSSGIIYYIKKQPPKRPPVPVAPKPTSTPNEQPTEQPTAQPNDQPIDQPATSDVGEEILVGVLAALLVAALVVLAILLLPEEIVAGIGAGLAALASWAFSW